MQRPNTPDGLFHAGNPITGEKGTPITSDWLNKLINVGAFLSGATEPPAPNLGGPGDYYYCYAPPSRNLYGPKGDDNAWPAEPVSFAGAADVMKGYATLALANADLANIAEGSVVWVNNDPDPVNNSNWLKDGGVLVQSSYDRIAVVEASAAAGLLSSIARAERGLIKEYPIISGTGNIPANGAVIVDDHTMKIPAGQTGNSSLRVNIFATDIQELQKFLGQSILVRAVFTVTDRNSVDFVWNMYANKTPAGNEAFAASVYNWLSPTQVEVTAVRTIEADDISLQSLYQITSVSVPAVDWYLTLNEITWRLASESNNKDQFDMLRGTFDRKFSRSIPALPDGVLTPFPAVVPSNGAVGIDNGFTIPVGQTGHSTFLFAYIPFRDADFRKYAGQKVRFLWRAVVDNWDDRVFTIGMNHDGGSAPVIESTNGSYDADSGIFTAEAIFTLDLSPTNMYLYAMSTTSPVTVAEFKMELKECCWEPVAYQGPLLVESVEMMATRKQIEHERRKQQLNPQPVHILYANRDPLSGADFTGRRAVQDAIDSITDASLDNQYEIRCTGTFEATVYADFDISIDGQMTFIRAKDNVHVVGVGSFNIIGTLPDGYVPALLCQPVFWNANSRFENCYVYGRNMNYALHIEGAGNSLDISRRFKNVHLKIQGANKMALGFGYSSGEELIAEDCSFDGTSSAMVCHTNKAFTRPCLLHLKRCRISSTRQDDSVLFFQSLGSGTADQFRLEDCIVDEGSISLTDSGWTNDNTTDADHAEIQLMAPDLAPRAVNNFGMLATCLKFTSKTTGVASTVRLDPASSAFDLIAGNSAMVATYEDQYYRTCTEGYAYQDGGVGLAGYAVTKLDICETAVSHHYRSLGKRLGDCSGVNKTLTIIVDGVTHNVVFDKNYNGTIDTVAANYTNAQIVTEILAVVGAVCDVELYAYGIDYYPEFAGVKTVTNTDVTAIIAGMGLTYTGQNRARLALNADGRINAIALDNIPVGGRGRVITRGELYTQFTAQRFRIKEVATATRAIGVELGISAGTPGVFDTAAVPKVLRIVRTDVARMI